MGGWTRCLLGERTPRRLVAALTADVALSKQQMLFRKKSGPWRQFSDNGAKTALRMLHGAALHICGNDMRNKNLRHPRVRFCVGPIGRPRDEPSPFVRHAGS